MCLVDQRLGVLREANRTRLPKFNNAHGLPVHSKPDGSDWSDLQWLEAVVGKVGAYANVSKKFNRGDIGSTQFHRVAGYELADILTYLDLLAFRLELDLRNCATRGFAHRSWAFEMDRTGWLASVVEDLGALSGFLNGIDQRWQHQSLEAIVGCVLLALFRLANAIDVDLCEVCRCKFNIVSDRVDVDVFINDQWEIVSESV